MSGRGANTARLKQACNSSDKRDNVDDVAAYAFDMLQSLRETCSDDNHRFLSYLIGMAAEEAQRLSEGLPSAAAQFAQPATPEARAKRH